MIETSIRYSIIFWRPKNSRKAFLAIFGEVNVLHHHAVTTANSREQNFILFCFIKILHLTK